jgi:hypothetical protein
MEIVPVLRYIFSLPAQSYGDANICRALTTYCQVLTYENYILWFLLCLQKFAHLHSRTLLQNTVHSAGRCLILVAFTPLQPMDIVTKTAFENC